MIKSQPRNLLSIATLNKARSRRFPVSSRRAQMAQTCLGGRGRLCPTRRPLFHALRFGVTAGSWTLDMISPSIQPSSPNINTALTKYYNPNSYVSFAACARSLAFAGKVRIFAAAQHRKLSFVLDPTLSMAELFGREAFQNRTHAVVCLDPGDIICT